MTWIDVAIWLLGLAAGYLGGLITMPLIWLFTPTATWQRRHLLSACSKMTKSRPGEFVVLSAEEMAAVRGVGRL